MTSINIDDFQIEVDDSLSIAIDSFRLLSILLIDHNRKNIFLRLRFLSISDIDFYRLTTSGD